MCFERKQGLRSKFKVLFMYLAPPPPILSFLRYKSLWKQVNEQTIRNVKNNCTWNSHVQLSCNECVIQPRATLMKGGRGGGGGGRGCVHGDHSKCLLSTHAPRFEENTPYWFHLGIH